MFHLNNSKKKVLDLLKDEVSKETLNKSFANVITFISTSINNLIQSLVEVCFISMKRDLFFLLFKP